MATKDWEKITGVFFYNPDKNMYLELDSYYEDKKGPRPIFLVQLREANLNPGSGEKIILADNFNTKLKARKYMLVYMRTH